MRKRNSLVWAAGVVLAASLSASADIPNPKVYPRPKEQPTPGAEVRLRIEQDYSTNEARLIIPREVLNQLRAEGEGGAQASPSAGLLGEGPGETQTVVAGLFLSLAFVLGGVWLVRARRAGGATARAALGVAGLMVLCGAGAAAVYANAPAVPPARRLDSNILVNDAKRRGAAGRVRVEVIEGSGQIMLLLPRDE